ncbi:PD40 domain-containing protein [candidate division KSB1 bacterium]|nr:PD40 domain-containing protein [candidate division KSB1 bacterium]
MQTEYISDVAREWDMLTNHRYENSDLAWSPDGRKIAFIIHTNIYYSSVFSPIN